MGKFGQGNAAPRLQAFALLEYADSLEGGMFREVSVNVLVILRRRGTTSALSRLPVALVRVLWEVLVGAEQLSHIYHGIGLMHSDTVRLH